MATLQKETSSSITLKGSTEIVADFFGTKHSYIGLQLLILVTNGKWCLSLRTLQTSSFMNPCDRTSHWNEWWLVGPTVFRGKFCQIPRRRLPNSADDRGKFLEFRGSPRPPMSIAWTTAEIWPFFDFSGRPPSWVFKSLKFYLPVH